MHASKHLGLALALAALGAATPATAALFRDAQLQGSWESGRLAELDRLAQARIRSHPGDLQAGAAAALSSLEEGDGARMEAAARSMQQCVEKQPREALCHFALGRLLGQQAMGASMFKAMSLAGRVKEAFGRAFELEPGSYEIRSALQQFYLMAPGVAGGDLGKARELARDARDPDQARLLRARVAMSESKFAEVERELGSARPSADAGLQRDWRDAWLTLGVQYLRDNQLPKARLLFEQLQRELPAHAAGAFGLGRVATESGQYDEAIRLFEQARTLEGADSLPVDHRLGVALQLKGDKAQARKVLERFVAAKRGNPRNLEDARKRLAELGAA